VSNNCLCCGKSLGSNGQKNVWHTKCIRNFFGTTLLPYVEISDSVFEELASRAVLQGVTVPGVQKKLSLHLDSDVKNRTARLTLIGYPAGYILKPQSPDFPQLPEAEHLVMLMAEKAGIDVVPHALIMLNDGSPAYITKRIDRVSSRSELHRVPMEDFCQISGRLTEDKYKGSYEQCAKIIKTYSSFPGLDASNLFFRLVFCFITGNSDMHLKNFSLIKNGEGAYRLSNAYDLLPVNIIMPQDTEETALTLNAKKSHITKKDFMVFAERSGVAPHAAEKMITTLALLSNDFCSQVQNSLLSDELKNRFCALIDLRSQRLR
jgi:serine/threonine-protein kinase HipA